MDDPLLHPLHVVILLVFIILLGTHTWETFTQQDVITKTPYDHSPIRVFRAKTGCRDVNSEQLLKKALNYWEKRKHSGLKISPHFTLVNSSDSADIIVEFTDNLPGDALGVTYYRLENGRLQDVRIIIECGYWMGSEYIPHNFPDLLNTMKHEIGHALGLGHTRNPFDIMAPRYELREYVIPTRYRYYYITAPAVILLFFLSVAGYLIHLWRIKKSARQIIEMKNK